MNSYEHIRTRLLRSAARQWGHHDSEMDLQAFDPVVRLLVEACAGELARLHRRLDRSRAEILERLLEQLSPEVLSGPLPAHALASIRAVDAEQIVGPDLQCYGTLERQQEKTAVYLAPVVNVPVVNAQLAFIEVGGKQLLRLNEGQQRERVAAGRGAPVPRGNTIWLGVALDRQVTEPLPLRFYFNWLNVPNLAQHLEWLARAEWRQGNRRLTTVRGIPGPEVANSKETTAHFLHNEYSQHQRAAARIVSHYAPHLVTVSGYTLDERQPYPPEFSEHYAIEDLTPLDEPLLWLQIAFPSTLPATDLSTMLCALNPVPVANLRMNRTEGRMREQLNIIPLPAEGHYFDIYTVRNRREIAYSDIPLTTLRNYRAGQYSVSPTGVGKLGQREAGHALLDMLDLLRDESAAFSAYGRDTLLSKITALNQLLKELEQLVTQVGTESESPAYLIVSPLADDRSVEVRYLSTRGAGGNGLITGQALELVRFAGVDRRSLRLLTGSSGGRDPLSAQERKYAYKKALVTRGRVVSREDIRAFCQSALGGVLQGMRLRKSATGSEDGGMRRVLLVELHLDPEGAASLPDLSARLWELERSLNHNSAGVLPILVRHTVGEPAETMRAV